MNSFSLRQCPPIHVVHLLGNRNEIIADVHAFHIRQLKNGSGRGDHSMVTIFFFGSRRCRLYSMQVGDKLGATPD